jgi:CBS domain-containing protein
MKAREIMTPNPFTVTPSEPISKVAELMRYEKVGCVPVVRDPLVPVLVGLITARDIAVRCVSRLHGHSCTAQDHMTPQPLATVGPDADVEEILRLMRERDVRRIPVVDEQGLLLGIVSERDLIETHLPHCLQRMKAALLPHAPAA